MTGDSLTMPSSIFGSPETPSQNAQGDGGFSSSDISESELDNILDQNLQSMRFHVEGSQKVNRTQKRNFFDEKLKGKKYLQYLQIFIQILRNMFTQMSHEKWIWFYLHTHNAIFYDQAYIGNISKEIGKGLNIRQIQERDHSAQEERAKKYADALLRAISMLKPIMKKILDHIIF